MPDAEKETEFHISPAWEYQSLYPGVRQIILYGHSHEPKIEEKGRVFYINPGHLKDSDKKGFPPSFAVLDVVREEIQVKIIGLKDKKQIEQFSILSVTE